MRLVQDAQGSRAPVQRLVDRIAAIFVPVILGIAVAAFVAWLLLDPEDGFAQGILAAVTVLVIACPCALGLATPTAIMVGIGKGAEAGILIRDAETLESAARIDTVVLDKTGTLTEGRPAVSEIAWAPDAEPAAGALLALGTALGASAGRSRCRGTRNAGIPDGGETSRAFRKPSRQGGFGSDRRRALSGRKPSDGR